MAMYKGGHVRGRIGRRLHIEAVTTCVQYSDFLAHTVLFNKQVFDRWIVVTTPDDEATRRMCEYHDIEYVVTTAFYDEQKLRTHGQGQMYRAPFAKGRAIDVGLKLLDRTGWVVHIDSDIALPPRTRDMFEIAELDERMIYGIDRLMAKSFDDWYAHLAYPEQTHDANIFVRGNTFPFNVRVAKHREPPPRGGWLPIGFFQMWHPGGSGIHDYPTQHSTAGRTDMQHSNRWPRKHRALIPEVVGVHLESEEVHMGANWEGRRTRFFGPNHMRRHETQHPKDEWQ